MEMAAETRKKDNFWIVFIIIVAAVVLLRVFVLEFVFISGESMVPTLHEGNLILINKVDYAPVRGDVVVLDTQIELVKRVIGLPGEKIQIKNGDVYINGQKLDDGYQYPTQAEDSMPQITIPQGSVFVMGDNRDHSSDSRVIGPVTIQSIRGKMMFSLW